jgi:hypothetical protein
MRPRSVQDYGRALLVLLLLPTCKAGADVLKSPGEEQSTTVAISIAQATPAYDRQLDAYLRARQQFADDTRRYWTLVVEKRRARIGKRRNNQMLQIEDYVLAQPPVYSGPPKPAGVTPPPGHAPPAYVPVIVDFLESAAKYFNFAPQKPRSEIEYKREYAKVASSVGLTMEQVVRIYGFESGGNGTYDVQAGLEYSPNAQAINTALGYNQLLNTNSVEIIAEHGDQFVQALETKAAASTGESRKMDMKKINVVREMVRFCRTVPDEWSEHDKLANTPQGLGVHAMNLDVDVGPLLQAQKLLNSVIFARQRGYKGVMSAAELEMMNLTGDGNGLEIVMMPREMRDRVPTANFFQEAGYERNPVAIRNNVVAKLLAATNQKMDREEKLQGARDLAAGF